VKASRRTDAARLALQERYERLETGRRTGWLVAVTRRFFAIDGLSQGGLLAIELFTTIIPLMIIGFAAFSGFAHNANIGDVFVRELGLHHPLDDTVRNTFASASGLSGTWTILGMAGWLVWGIPMSLTVSSMFSLAWVRDPFPIGSRIWRGILWFVLYLAMMSATERLAFAASHTTSSRVLLWTVGLVPCWIFWSATPVLLVRDGAKGWRYLGLAGLAGVLVDGVGLRLAMRIVFPGLLQGWTGFGPIGVAMTLMTWCGVIGVVWVVIACMGAVIWERSAPAETVIDAQSPTVELEELSATG
jgi:hypothetical protein